MNLLQKYRQFIKFSVVSLGYNFIAYCIYAVLIFNGSSYFLASSTSFVFGVILGYFLNKSLVFNTKQKGMEYILYYFAYYVLLLVINLALLHGFINWLEINPYAAQILVTIIAAFMSYRVMGILFMRENKWGI
ncbi:GtrA-like protein [Legionella wadsworthii]|uniref:GtrA-like protein n=1 Tax=Legionella wadsworthii TaxID=28088 RepID=A0A378LZL8_9GAMM|nr:GtrA family protein [Legionella wadsworthii]STY29511.1 GtrA-like protein [Legionella wadsworthii]